MEALHPGSGEARSDMTAAVTLGRPEDVLRVARRAAESSELPPPDVTAAARSLAAQLARVAAAVLRDEIGGLLMGNGVHLALQWLADSAALGVVLPELSATIDFSQEGGRRHKDVWEHTKQVVRQSVRRPHVRWAALLHDIGKVPTRTFTADGKVHFHGHSEVGARMFDDVARRFAFAPADRQIVRFLILHHLRANQYDPSWTDSAVRRFDREMGQHLTDLLDLSRADITSKRPGRRQEALESISQLAQRIAQLRQLDALEPPLPTGLGNAIMEQLGVPPSKRIGDLKRLCEAAVEAGELEARQASEYYVEWLRKAGHG
jgi:poly(A) polymerase